MDNLPVWDTESLYRDFSDPKYRRDAGILKKTVKALADHLKTLPPADQAGPWILTWYELGDTLSAAAEQLGSFTHMLYSVDTKNQAAILEMGKIEEVLVPVSGLNARFLEALKAFGRKPAELFVQTPDLKARKLQVQEDFDQISHQMSPDLEDLAADLERAGGSAWSRLQSSLSGNLTAVWDPATGETKTVVELRALASHPDRALRKKAFDLELAAWDSIKIPMAASLNGVKGTASTLNRRRHWKSALDLACRQARMSPAALQAMIETMTESLPSFHGYLKDKATALGVPKLGFFDLFAPVGQDSTVWTWDKASTFIVEKFGAFNPALADFARTAFDKNWIHPKPLPGKVGGAYCTSLPLSRQPRILSNFDGSFGELKTLAHELGHGYHFWLLRKQPAYRSQYPMTLAETASIFCETIIFEEAVKQTSGPARGFVLEQQLQDVTQVIVDILSRFQFETAVFERREQGELSAEEFCRLMTDAQKATYGSGLDHDQLHPWMWAVKGHYYSTGLGYYNFPYAFGQLFSYALYGLYQQEGSPFLKKYDRLLLETGIKTADELAKGLGFDLKKKEFWQRGLAVAEGQIRQFNQFVKGR